MPTLCRTHGHIHTAERLVSLRVGICCLHLMPAVQKVLYTTLIFSTHATGMFQFFSQALTCHLNSYPREDGQ